jgi:hypothetical protein
MVENDEVDKLIWNSLCHEITEKVMDLDNAHPMDHNRNLKNFHRSHPHGNKALFTEVS